jgi:hypothetical protein
MERLQQDVLTIRKRIGPVPVVLLADGAPELWKLFARHLDERSLGVEPVRADRCLACARIRGGSAAGRSAQHPCRNGADRGELRVFVYLRTIAHI